MNILRNTLRALLPAAALLLCGGCSADDEAAAPGGGGEGETVTVPLTIDLARTWTTGDDEAPESRDVPNPPALDVDGWAETVGTDSVRIVTFRRRSTDAAVGGDGSTNNAPFVYDPSNDYTWEVIQAGDDGTGANDRFYAEGTITKRYGFEYRVVGIAYSSKRTLSPSNGLLPPAGEAGLFSLNLADGLTYDSFMASLTEKNPDEWEAFWGSNLDYTPNDPTQVKHDGSNLWTRGHYDGRLVYTPQLFYGYCHADGSDDPIIKYADFDPEEGKYVTDTPLTGTLYRAMAKIEMHLKPRDRNFGTNVLPDWENLQGAFLMANNVRIRTALTDYDDFLPQTDNAQYTSDMQDDGRNSTDSEKKYTVIASHVERMKDADEYTLTLTAYVLPTKTKLALRVMYINYAILQNQHNYNYAIDVADLSSAEAATGVISPDVQDGVFYLRRNHKYVFYGDLNDMTDNEID